MNKDINLIVEDFRNEIIDKCNHSQLPAAMVYYVMKDVFNMISTQYDDYIAEARQLEQQKQQQSAEESLDN